MSTTPCPRGLYLLADESALPFSAWPDLLPRILDAGVALVQYRGKTQSAAERQDHAGQLLRWCRAAGRPLLINDSPDLALQLGADGVHLGRDDAALQRARSLLPASALIGASCYADIARAHSALTAGADYVSFGRLFDSTTKPEASPASLNTLRQAATELAAPICAIGGITADNAASVVAAGARLICVAGGILRAEDPVAATRKLATICGSSKAPYP